MEINNINKHERRTVRALTASVPELSKFIFSAGKGVYREMIISHEYIVHGTSFTYM